MDNRLYLKMTLTEECESKCISSRGKWVSKHSSGFEKVVIFILQVVTSVFAIQQPLIILYQQPPHISAQLTEVLDVSYVYCTNRSKRSAVAVEQTTEIKSSFLSKEIMCLSSKTLF